MNLAVGGSFPGDVANPSPYTGNLDVYSIDYYVPWKQRMASVQTRKWKQLRQRKLTDKQVERARALPWERGSLARLAREFGVTSAVIWNVRHGLTYKRPGLQQTYVVRVTDGGERYSLGTFLTPEAAQHAMDTFKRTNKWPRGSVERQKDGRYRARLSLGVYDTRRAAERVNRTALKILNGALDERGSHPFRRRRQPDQALREL
jgi:hypothetical protein